MTFSDALNNLEDHIAIDGGATQSFHLISKDAVPEDFEQLLEESVSSTPNSSENIPKDISTASVASVANSSDSDMGMFF